MVTRQIKLEGPGIYGTVVRAGLLRDLLGIVIEGSAGAVRLRTQGRSVARGTPPAWIPKASDFLVRILKGSTLLEIKAPTLLEARPEELRQAEMFPEIDPDLTSFDYFVESVESAIEEEESSAFDKNFLVLLSRFEGIFAQGIDSVFLKASPQRHEREIQIRRADPKRFRALQRRIPAPRRVRIAGKLDSIRHSDSTYLLLLPDGQKIRGIAEHIPSKILHRSWGQPVVMSGTAFFTASGDIQRIESDNMGDASDRDVQLWAFAPPALETTLPHQSLRVSQGPRSGLNAIIGKWPGEESDEEVAIALKELS